MKFCSIVPLNNCDLMYENDYVMLLAHLSKKSAIYANKARLNKNYKIMDNSIIEIGEAFNMQDLINEAIKCDVNEIILPDVFAEGEATVEKVKESIKRLKDNNYLGRFKLMAVCHGKNIDEFFKCFCRLDEMEEIDVIGIPKVISQWVISRVQVAEILTRLTKKEIHLLGCYYSLRELREFSRDTKVRSMDTCLPALLSIYDMDTLDNRNGLKIDLETANINIDKYNKIMSDVNILCSAITN